ncbi:hypothetical protein EVAR_33424_1 [Eumeta japonica]|uniref:Uncharacterized protein n=1 Tax=Eumeta variegata TaxID=151549 RepID=A0A4C1W0E1_EUMVA|nr:hypothetical protein EVAR_33424_1 [Eumeta japonica]
MYLIVERIRRARNTTLAVHSGKQRRAWASGSARVRVCVVPRSVHRAPTVKLRAFVPVIHSGLLHHLYAEPAHSFCV